MSMLLDSVMQHGIDGAHHQWCTMPYKMGDYQQVLKPCLHHAIFAAGNARRVNRRCGDPHCWCTCVFTWSDVARKWAGRNHVIRGVT